MKKQRPDSANRQHAGTAWTKSHQLEGDGLLTLLYHHLWKKNKSFQSCPGIKLPDTVVYEHNFPRAWYTYEFKNSEISKRAGRFLDTHHIYHAFSKTQGVDICAQYLFASEGEHGITTSVEFMNPKELEHFLNHRKSRPDGILQKFLPTAGCNAQIQAVWSPRVTLIQRRVNKHRLCDRNVSTYHRAVTYDGPTHYSDEGLCSGRTKNQILSICNSLVDHFNLTEHKLISRFVIYFKVSPVPKHAAADGHNAIWLLWASSLRIDENKFGCNSKLRPLNLSPNISIEQTINHQSDNPSKQPLSAASLREGLLAVDSRQLALSRDSFFARMCNVRRPKTARTRNDKRTAEGSPRLERTKSFQHPHPPSAPQGNRRPVTAGRVNCHEIKKEIDPESSDEDTPWWDISPSIRVWYENNLENEKLARLFVDDAVYGLYSHLLRNGKTTFHVSVPSKVNEFLSLSDVDDVPKLMMLMKGILGMSEYDTKSGMPLPAGFEPATSWHIEADAVPPFGMQITEVANFIDRVSQGNLRHLKNEAVNQRSRVKETQSPEIIKTATFDDKRPITKCNSNSMRHKGISKVKSMRRNEGRA